MLSSWLQEIALAWGVAVGSPFLFKTTMSEEYKSDIYGTFFRKIQSSKHSKFETFEHSSPANLKEHPPPKSLTIHLGDSVNPKH